jgi:hypothetical protein
VAKIIPLIFETPFVPSLCFVGVVASSRLRERLVIGRVIIKRVKVVMLAAPLSMSIAAGVSARISEIRPPLKYSTRQKSCTSKGARRAALMKRRRSAALGYFRLPVGP